MQIYLLNLKYFNFLSQSLICFLQFLLFTIFKDKIFSISSKIMTDLLTGIPQSLKKIISENLQQRSPFIKMKRLTEIDDSLLIINEEMSLNVSFTSPILETLQYLEQLEKYKLRAIFSTFPFTSKQFDKYYNEIQSLIMLKYKSNITNIMKILYELINVAGCEKINEMKMYTEMFSKIKDKLLLNRNKTDIYGFNVSQFDKDKQSVKTILKFSEKYINLHNHQSSESQGLKQHENFRLESKRYLEELTNKIKSTTIKMMDKMNDCQILQPYVPQNIAYEIININAILQSYWKKMKIYNLSVEQQLIKKRKSVQIHVKKLYQEGLMDYKEDTIVYASSLIDSYNKSCKDNQIYRKASAPVQNTKKFLIEPLFNQQNRRSINLQDINVINFEEKSENKSILNNIKKEVKFNNHVKFVDLQSKNEEIVEIKDSKRFPNPFSKHLVPQTSLGTNDIVYSQMVNPFLLKKNNKNLILPQDFNQHNNLNNRLDRKQQLKQNKMLTYTQNIDRLDWEFKEFKAKIEQENQPNLRRQIGFTFSKQLYDGIQNGMNWIVEKLFGQVQINDNKSTVQQNKAQDSNSFDQVKAFMKKKNFTDEHSKAQIKDKNTNLIFIPDHKPFYFKTQQEKMIQTLGQFSLLTLQQQKSRIQLSHENYEKQKIVEYQRRIQSLIAVIRMKTYEKFCALSINPKTKKGGLETKTFLNNEKSYRYGIEIQVNLQKYFAISNSENSDSSSVAIKLPPLVLQQLNKYFFYTFKQLYYRFNKKVEENSQIPILMTLENEQEILNEKMIKKILTLMKKYDFFVLWTLGDLIVYEEKVQFGHRRAHITIALFWGTQRIARGMVWELKKRVDETFKQEQSQNNQSDHSKQKQCKYSLEEFYESYFMSSSSFKQNKETINEIFAKIEFVHRKLYSRHKRPLTIDKTIVKGKQLWKQLIQRKWQK